MNEMSMRMAVHVMSLRAELTANATALTRHRLRDERGEGVISTAIAVLIVALIGVGALVAFRALVTDAGNNARNQVNNYSA
jgi:hypothetical protein